MFKTLLAVIIFMSLISPAIAENGHESHNHSKHMQEPELIITPIAPNELKASEANEVILFIQDKKAKPVDISQFEVAHTKPVHLLIIETGLNDYHHEHPVQNTTGQYAFTFKPRTDCSYRVWADVQLKGSHQQYIPVDLKGMEECNEPINKVANYETSSQGYDFKLELEGDIKIGEAVIANLIISKNGELVDFLEPVMGAFAHMVGFYEDYKTIAHIHPMGEEPNKKIKHGGPVLSFHIEPEHTGYLKLFAQVQINDKQIFAPFSLLIK